RFGRFGRARVAWRTSPLLSCVNNEALRRRSHVIKWVAGHQGQLCILRSMQYLNVMRIDDFGAIHSVSKDPAESRQGDYVVGLDFSHRTKESVAMCRDPDVSHRAWKSSALYMTGTDAKNARIRSFKNHH